MLSRRALLVAAGAAGLSGFAGLRFVLADPEQAIVAVLRKRLDYLRLDDDGLAAFARDVLRRDAVSKTRLRALSAVGLMALPLDVVGVRPAVLRNGEERIVTFYLLSTDFFANGADVSRVVRYLGYYDPFLRPCQNPFPRSVTDPAA